MLPAAEQFHYEMQGIHVDVADTPAAILEAQALRHQVFCLERGIFTAEAGQTSELDEFDARSRHVVIRDTTAGAVVATARVVAGSSAAKGLSLPMQRFCSPAIFHQLPMDTVGEISRFAISKQFRTGVSASGPLIRLALLKGILRVSGDMGLTHWCALMEPTLLRLLAATGVHFAPLGPMVDAYGRRQPSVAAITFALAQGRRQKPDYYFMVSDTLPYGPLRQERAPSEAPSHMSLFASASAAAAAEAERGQRSAQNRDRSRLRC